MNNNSNNIKSIKINNNNNNNNKTKIIKLKDDNSNDNNSDDNIKSIQFSDSNNNNINEIKFNNNNNENNNIKNFLKDDKDIVISQEFAIENKDLVYNNDIVYLKELTNQLLSEYPLLKQDSKFIQNNIKKEIEKILHEKNKGIQKIKMLNNGIEYNYINNIVNNNFTNSFLIPIVLDKHRIYTKLKEEDVNNENIINSNIYFTETQENKTGIIEENQKNQMKNLWDIYHQRILNKISYKKSIHNEFDLVKPYLIDNVNKTKGYIIKPSNNTDVLRYYDLETIYWNKHKINNDYKLNKEIYNEFGQIKKIEENIFINGDKINIVGFMLMNKLLSDVHSLHKTYEKRGTITNIYNNNEFIRIECKNHNLNENNIIYINETNSFPIVDNVYFKSIKIINNDIIEIKSKIKLFKNGNFGNLYIYSNLKYDLYKVIKNKKNDIDISFLHSTYSNNKNNHNNNKIYLFDTIDVNINEYKNIIQKIIPNVRQIIENENNKIQKIFTFNDIHIIFKKYNLTINDLHIDEINEMKVILNNNVNKLLDNLNNKKKIVFQFHKKNNFDNNYFLSNKFITNKNIEKIYGKYIYLNKPEDNFFMRLKWLENQRDKGIIYYLHYLIEINNEININKHKIFIENKIKELQKKSNEIETILKKNKSTKKNSVILSNNNNTFISLYTNDKYTNDKYKDLKFPPFFFF